MKASPELQPARVHRLVQLARLATGRDPRRQSHRRGPDRSARRSHHRDGPCDGQERERDPPIFYIDGYWRTDGSTSGFAYNGRATIAATKSVIFSDSLLYLGSLSNVNKEAPETWLCRRCRGTAPCGAADMLGIMAQEDIWTGDPNGRIYEVDAVLLAGRDVNLVQYATADTCCRGSSNPLTFNGTLLGAPWDRAGAGLGQPVARRRGRRLAMARSHPAGPSRSSRRTRAAVTRMDAGGSSARTRRPGSSPWTPVWRPFASACRPRPANVPTGDPPSDALSAQHQLRHQAPDQSRADPPRPADRRRHGSTASSPPGQWKDCGGNPSCS